MAEEKKRVLSGMRPTGKLHLGHFHGVLDNWLKLQKEYECYFFVADWHALTSDYADTSGLKENIREMMLDWLSVGIDPAGSTIFVQSAISEHAELALLLSMITPLSWLERNPTHKEQLAELEGRDVNTYGFLGYPVLQTADIIMYMANVVPVGLDQAPHVELPREITRRFNHLYGPVFPEPKTLLTEASKLLGTDGRKMSKSYNNSIYLSDEPKTIEKKMRTMKTDPARQRKTDPGDPDLCPVYTSFHTLYSNDKTRQWVEENCKTAGIGCIDCKMAVIEKVLQRLEPIQKRRKELEGDTSKLNDILRAGEEVARAEAVKTMSTVRKKMNLNL